jgi:hypothetical protein
MYFLFKRSKKRHEYGDAVTKNALGKRLEMAYLFVQSKWVQWMTKQTANLSPRNLLIVWGTFIAFSAGYSICLIAKSLSGKAPNVITVIPIAKPINALSTAVEPIQKSSSVSKTELEKIIRFRAYVDSLSRSPTGKRVLDSITDKRPGLLDSLAIIENYYQSHFKKYYNGK